MYFKNVFNFIVFFTSKLEIADVLTEKLDIFFRIHVSDLAFIYLVAVEVAFFGVGLDLFLCQHLVTLDNKGTSDSHLTARTESTTTSRP